MPQNNTQDFEALFMANLKIELDNYKPTLEIIPENKEEVKEE